MLKNTITVIGARPQFIKAAPVSKSLKACGINDRIIHTGQHYDAEMSSVFFSQMGIPLPAWTLDLGGGTHGQMTGRMLEAIEGILLQEKPEAVIVYGDTNSTIAGALAAAKLNIPVAHVESGLRSFNRRMPEELNRICTDHLARWHFCSSAHGVEQLLKEGIANAIDIGDVMADAFFAAGALVAENSAIATGLPANLPTNFVLLTLHRADTASDAELLFAILSELAGTGEEYVFPIHPRTRKLLDSTGKQPPGSIHLISPVGYLEMIRLLQLCTSVVTDSGGLQKEAYWAGKPCTTLRNETEWTETLVHGWNILATNDPGKIRAALATPRELGVHLPLYGDGTAADKLAAFLANQDPIA